MLMEQFLAQADLKPRLRLYAADAAPNGVRIAASVQEAEEIFHRCMRWAKDESERGSLGEKCAGIALNVANRCQREQEGAMALRIFDEILALAGQTNGAAIPPDLVARVAIPTGSFASLLSPPDQLEFINKLADWGKSHFDDHTRWNCILALYNVTSNLVEHDLANAEKALAAMCEFYADRPDWSMGYCLGAAARLVLSSDSDSIGNRVRALLQDQVPAALDPGFLARKEAQWKVDLHRLKGDSKRV
jgi:hypothetical protein